MEIKCRQHKIILHFWLQKCQTSSPKSPKENILKSPTGALQSPPTSQTVADPAALSGPQTLCWSEKSQLQKLICRVWKKSIMIKFCVDPSEMFCQLINQRVCLLLFCCVNETDWLIVLIVAALINLVKIFVQRWFIESEVRIWFSSRSTHTMTLLLAVKQQTKCAERKQ